MNFEENFGFRYSDNKRLLIFFRIGISECLKVLFFIKSRSLTPKATAGIFPAKLSKLLNQPKLFGKANKTRLKLSAKIQLVG